jgi:hypothetical protein
VRRLLPTPNYAPPTIVTSRKELPRGFRPWESVPGVSGNPHNRATVESIREETTRFRRTLEDESNELSSYFVIVYRGKVVH